MSTSTSSTIGKSAERPHVGSGKRRCGDAKWSPMNIAAMVLGFVLFWPVGLVVLFWIMSGRDARELPHAVKHKFRSILGHEGGHHHYGSMHSDNVVFNEYQQTQFDRIREIKEEIGERARRFHAYRANAKRRADEEEFNQFMSNNPGA